MVEKMELKKTNKIDSYTIIIFQIVLRAKPFLAPGAILVITLKLVWSGKDAHIKVLVHHTLPILPLV